MHDKRRYYCAECDGRRLCATPVCTTTVQRIGDYCKVCVPSPTRNSRSAEIRIAGFLQACADAGDLPGSWTTWNKQIATADPTQCGRRRPDFLYDIDDEQRVVIVEVDEHAHESYDRRCELGRQAEVATSFGGRQVILIRFNPDALVSEPWIKAIPAKERRTLLLECLKQALAPGQPGCFDNHLRVTVHCLFYPPFDAFTEPTQQQTFTFARVQPDYEAWADGGRSACSRRLARTHTHSLTTPPARRNRLGHAQDERERDDVRPRLAEVLDIAGPRCRRL